MRLLFTESHQALAASHMTNGFPIGLPTHAIGGGAQQQYKATKWPKMVLFSSTRSTKAPPPQQGNYSEGKESARAQTGTRQLRGGARRAGGGAYGGKR
jgi:hypothetical protein